jgi:hypothetical protein
MNGQPREKGSGVFFRPVDGSFAGLVVAGLKKTPDPVACHRSFLPGVKRTLAVVAALVALLPSPECRAAGTEKLLRGHDLMIAVDSRWAGGANGGYYPIRIRVTNTARERDLLFEFFSAGGGSGDSHLPTVRRRIHIDQNATQQFSLPVPLASPQSSGILRISERNSSLDMDERISLPDAQTQGIDRPSLLVISPSSVDCDRFEDAVNSVSGIAAAAAAASSGGYYPYGSGTMRTSDHAVIPPQLLPESWIEYTGLDIVALPLDVLGRISPSARTALLNWVEAGGTLIVYSVGEPAARSKELTRLLDLDNRPPVSRTWHDAIPGEHRPIALASPAASSGTVFISPGRRAAGVPSPAPGEVELSAGANTAVWPVEATTFSRVDILSGQAFAFPANPFPGAPVDWAWWLNSARPERVTWTSRHGLSSRTRHSEFFQFLIPGVGGVPVFAFLSLITLFALAIGPVNYWFMWKRKQLYMLVVSIPAIAFFTSCALFGYGMVADGFGVRSRLRSLTVLDQHARTAVSYNRIALYAGLTPSAGLSFSPDTAVLPIWRDFATFTGGAIDWTGGQHLTTGWLRSRTQTQFETISHRPERGRLEFKPIQNGNLLEVSNGLEWDLDQLVVKDEGGRLYYGAKIPTGGATQLQHIQPADLESLADVLDNNPLIAPDGVTGDDYSPFSGGRRRMYRAMIYGAPDTPTNFSRSLLESRLQQLRHPADEPVRGGMSPQTYLAVVKQNPGIELGVERTTQYGGVHVILGYY